MWWALCAEEQDHCGSTILKELFFPEKKIRQQEVPKKHPQTLLQAFLLSPKFTLILKSMQQGLVKAEGSKFQNKLIPGGDKGQIKNLCLQWYLTKREERFPGTTEHTRLSLSQLHQH